MLGPLLSLGAVAHSEAASRHMADRLRLTLSHS